ncbi:class I SAM-dependent methyltransferase [Nitrosopumilus sp.]|nr:class I SAM-dependent methyltransferase [Nitrosopumilus sp.]
MTSSEESIESVSDASEFNLERVLPNDERTKFLFQEHTIRYLFASQFTTSKSVLDAACGSGYGSAILSKSGATKVVGIDNSSEAIEYCEKNYKKENLEFKKDNCEKITLDTTFDVVVSFETIEHLKNQDNFLTEVKRVLKDDGIFIVSTPNTDTYPSDNPFHYKEFTESEFKLFLGKYFSNITIFYQYYPSSMAISKPADIMNDLKINFFNAQTYQIDDISKKFNLDNSDGLFFVAICSNNPIANIDNKLYLYSSTINQLSSPEEHELTHLDELRELNMKKDENLKTFEKKAGTHMDELRDLNQKKDENLKTFETKAVTHMDELRELNMKKDENLKTFEKKALTHMDELRELNMKKDEDIEHLRNIIKQIHESPAWKLIKKIDFLKKNN